MYQKLVTFNPACINIWTKWWSESVSFLQYCERLRNIYCYISINRNTSAYIFNPNTSLGHQNLISFLLLLLSCFITHPGTPGSLLMFLPISPVLYYLLRASILTKLCCLHSFFICNLHTPATFVEVNSVYWETFHKHMFPLLSNL